MRNATRISLDFHAVLRKTLQAVASILLRSSQPGSIRPEIKPKV
jgi:hypothetical protein